MADNDPNGPPTGPTFIPISLVPDNPTIITGPSSVDFLITVPFGYGGLPLTVSYYEVTTDPTTGHILPLEQTLTMQEVEFPDVEQPDWENGLARFTLEIDNNVFSNLTAAKTVLAVVVRINDPNDVDMTSLGITGIPIYLPDSAKP